MKRDLPPPRPAPRRVGDFTLKPKRVHIAGCLNCEYAFGADAVFFPIKFTGDFNASVNGRRLKRGGNHVLVKWPCGTVTEQLLMLTAFTNVFEVWMPISVHGEQLHAAIRANSHLRFAWPTKEER